MKILATSMQMLSVFGNEDSYPVATPPPYAVYIESASAWANLDFYSFFNLGWSALTPKTLLISNGSAALTS